jgi:hypothetical protein
VRDRGRHSLAGTLSLLLHAGLLFAGTCSLGLNVPDFSLDIEFKEVEFIDIEAEQAPEEEPVEEPPLVDGPALPPGGLPADAPEEQDAPKPEKKFGDKTARVHKLAPEASTFYMFMAARRIRKLHYAEDFLDAFSPQDDFRFLVDGGGFHPWKDFDYMLIASSNIADPTQNFIAVSHRLDAAAIRSGINRACANFNLQADWVVRDGKEMVNPRPLDPEVEDNDPRWFIILDDKTAIYIRDEFLDAVIKGDDGSKKKTARNFVAQVTKMRRYARAEPNAGFTLVFKDIRKAIKGGGGAFKIPNSADFTFEAATAPEVVLKASWPNADEAEQFVEFFKSDLKKFIDGSLAVKMAVGSLYKSVKVTRDGKQVVLRSELSKSQAKSLAEMIAGQARKLTETSDDAHEKSKAMREQSRAQMEEEREARKRGDLPTDAPAPEPHKPKPPKKDETPALPAPTEAGDGGD